MKSDLTIIDMISEKHIVLRRAFEDRWKEKYNEEISHTEALLLGKLSRGRISIAEVARQANISRQAMFKCAKKLEERGYIETAYDENNSKYFKPTDKGINYFIESEKVKEEIQEEIKRDLGEENFNNLIMLLNKI